MGRLDFELFGKEAPKSVNNFLAFCTGDFDPYLRYKNSSLHAIHEQRFILGGDFVSGDGTGSATVYRNEHDGKTMQAEKNTIVKFDEPYLLAMSANKEGQTGCQFFITLDRMPALNGTDHTIIGRLFKGRDTISYLEGMQEYRSSQDFIKRRIQEMPLTLGTKMNPEESKSETSDEVVDARRSRVIIKDSGAYKFSQSDKKMMKTTAVDRYDF